MLLALEASKVHNARAHVYVCVCVRVRVRVCWCVRVCVLARRARSAACTMQENNILSCDMNHVA